MKKKNVIIGGKYLAKVSGKIGGYSDKKTE